MTTPREKVRQKLDLEIERRRSAKGDRISRHALTRLHPNIDIGQLRYGVWNRPNIDLSNPGYLGVTQAYVGRLDIVSTDAYQDPRFWWAIATVNNIKNPLSDMEVGMTLIIPRKEAIIEAIATGNRDDFGV